MKSNKLVSIVTPVYNGEEFIEKCIQSVLNQTYKNIEHIIVDGGSTDNTLNIINKYKNKYNMRYISEKDNGMYDAINKGFMMAKGDIYAWLNSDDMYMPWAIEVIEKVMTKADINWCTCIPAYWNINSILTSTSLVINIYSRRLLKKGYYNGKTFGFVQQESTFWTKKLWDISGGIDTKYKLAGDYYLWKKFSEYDYLYTLDTVVSGFRVHKNQQTANINNYFNELPTIPKVLTFITRYVNYMGIINLFISLINKKKLIHVNKYIN